MTDNDISPHEKHKPTHSYSTCPSLTYWHPMVLLLLILCCDNVCCVTAFWFALNANCICLVYIADFVCMLSDSSVNFSDMSFEIQISILWFLRTYHKAQEPEYIISDIYVCTYVLISYTCVYMHEKLALHYLSAIYHIMYRLINHHKLSSFPLYQVYLKVQK